MSTENVNTTTDTTKQKNDHPALVKKPTEPPACDNIVVHTK